MQNLKNLVHNMHINLIDIRYLIESARLSVEFDKTTEASEKLSKALEEVNKVLGDN